MLLPGPFYFGCEIRLGDLLVASVRETSGIRLVEGNCSADKFGNEVVAISSDPDVSSLVDDKSATRVQEGSVLLVSGSQRQRGRVDAE